MKVTKKASDPGLQWTQSDLQFEAAERIWDTYQDRNDLSDLRGKAAGVDLLTETVWIGDSIPDVWTKREKHGLTSPLYWFRIGYPAYFKKGRKTDPS